jgi:hypothetical protein
VSVHELAAVPGYPPYLAVNILLSSSYSELCRQIFLSIGLSRRYFFANNLGKKAGLNELISSATFPPVFKLA